MTNTSVFLDMLFACLQVIALAGLGVGLVWMLNERAHHPIVETPPERRPNPIVVVLARPAVMPTSEIAMPHMATSSSDRPSVAITD